MSRAIPLFFLLLLSLQVPAQLRLGSIRSDSLFGKSIDTVCGATISLLANNKYERINGFDFGLIANEANQMNGLALGLLFNRTGRFNGAAIGGIVNHAGGGAISRGLALAVAYNGVHASQFRGLALTAGVNYFPYKYAASAVNGCVLSGLVTKIKSDNTNAFVFSGLYNSFGNHFNGVAISALGNRGRTTNAFLFGAVNSVGVFKGAAIGVYNMDMSAQGMKIGLVNISNNYSSSGFSIGVLTNYNIRWDLSKDALLRSTGLYLTGGINFYNQFSGMSIAGVGNLAEEFNGVGIAPGMNFVGSGKGVLIAGLANYTPDGFRGVCISLVNIGASTCQIGLINISRTARVQIGLLNFNKAARVKVLPVVNFAYCKEVK